MTGPLLPANTDDATHVVQPDGRAEDQLVRHRCGRRSAVEERSRSLRADEPLRRRQWKTTSRHDRRESHSLDRRRRRKHIMIVEIADRGSAYIRYRVGERVAEPQIEVGGEASEVLADVNAAGDIIGIEIVDVAIPENIARARAFAAERGLQFPRDLVAAARGAAVA